MKSYIYSLNKYLKKDINEEIVNIIDIKYYEKKEEIVYNIYQSIKFMIISKSLYLL